MCVGGAVVLCGSFILCFSQSSRRALTALHQFTTRRVPMAHLRTSPLTVNRSYRSPVASRHHSICPRSQPPPLAPFPSRALHGSSSAITRRSPGHYRRHGGAAGGAPLSGGRWPRAPPRLLPPCRWQVGGVGSLFGRYDKADS